MELKQLRNLESLLRFLPSNCTNMELKPGQRRR